VLIEPTLIKVSDGFRPLRVVAFRKSANAQVVRIWAKHSLEKTSRAEVLKPIELRPEYQREAESYIPGLNIPSYWLAVQVYNNSGDGWVRSPLRIEARHEVPAIEIAFEDRAPEAGVDSKAEGIVISVLYS